MKKTYKLTDGGAITAGSPSEFLTELRKSSKFESEASDEIFMMHFAERMKTYNGIKLRTDSPEHLFDDLLACGYVVE